MKQCFLKLFIFICFSSYLYSLEKVSLQLKWFHQFQFAGYYAAKEKGFYKEVGLDVEIKERDLKNNNIYQVINGESQYGIADSVLILYKTKGEPIHLVSPIFQHSPSVFISLKDSGLNSPYKLNDKNILFYTNDTDGFSLLAMLNKLNIKPNLIRKREKDDYQKLINKNIDLMPAYLSNEPFIFKRKNIDIDIINPSNFGFDLYGDLLFTNSSEVQNYPDRVKRFKEASLRGWEYALNNKEEIVQLIHKKYNKNKSIEHLRYEANVIEKLISKDIIPLGVIDEGRIQYISDLYLEFGLASSKLDINKFIFQEFVKKEKKVNLSKEEVEYLSKNPVLKVQNLTSFPPYNFYNNEPMGYTVDYMNLLGKTLGVKIEFIEKVSWKDSLSMIKANELDIIPHIAKSKKRENFINFTNIKHTDYNTSLVMRKDSIITKFDDLKGKKVSVLNKSILHTLIMNNYPSINLYTTNTIKEVVESVASGKVDAGIDNLATLEYYINQNWLSNLKTIKLDNIEGIPGTFPLYIGVSKNNEILKSILEKTHNLLSYNKQLKLKEKWLNYDFSSKIKFSDEEYSYLLDKKELNYCIDPNWMPFEKIENGIHIGMTSEYIKLFKKDLPVEVKLKNTKDWLQTVEYIKNRQCDFVSIMMSTPERKKYLNFTNSLMKMPLVIATKTNKPFIHNLEGIKNEKLAVVKGFAYSDILKQKYPNLDILEVDSAYDGLLKVNANQAYGFLGLLPVVGSNIQNHFLGNLKIAGKLEDSLNFPMAVRSDEPLLNSVLNKLINNISIEKKQEILNKWLSIKYEEKIDYKLIFILTLFFTVILIITVTKNRAITKINKNIKSLNNKLFKSIKVIDEHVLTSSTDKKGIIIEASQAFCDISGYSKEELIGKKHNIVRHEEMPNELYSDMWSTILSGKIWKGEIKNKKKNGDFYWVYAVVSPNFDENEQIIGFTSIRHDITDKKKIEQISITDDLTRLFNKRYFNEIFSREVNRAKRENHQFALIVLDIDFFKQYNDSYGHQKGDEVLEKVGKKLNLLCKRSSDFAFRVGGEEFAIIFTPNSKNDAMDFAKLINKEIVSLKINHKVSSISDYVTASIGLYISEGDKIDSVKNIYNFADKALYKAKENGRNQFVLYSDNFNGNE